MVRSKNYIQIMNVFLASSLCFSALLFFLYKEDNKFTHNGLQPIRGVFCLTEEDLQEDVFYLSREWQYYPDVLLTPEDFSKGLPDTFMQFITIGKYNNLTMGKNTRSPYGKATYRLILELPQQPMSYAITLPEIYTAYDFYINDTLMLSMGNPTTSDIQIGTQTVTFTASGPTTLLLATSNQSHYYGGLTFSPTFGKSQLVLKEQNNRLILNSMAMFFIVFVGIYSIYVGLSLHMEYSKFFALLCLCLLTYISYPVFFILFTVKTRFWHGIELIATYGMYLLLVELHRIVYRHTSRLHNLVRNILIVFCFLAMFYAFVPVPYGQFYSLFSFLSLCIKLMTAIYLLGFAIYMILKKHWNTYILLSATIIFAISLFADRLFPLFEPIYGGFFPEYGGFIIGLALGFMLWQDMTHAYRFNLSLKEEKRLLTSQVAMQKSHYSELLERIDQTIRQRHDLRHHLRTIYKLLLDQDVNRAIDYLSDCDVRHLNKERLIICEHLIVDAILQYYKAQCSTYQIDFNAAVELPLDLPLEDTDLSILLGNLLENALDASKSYNGGNAFIRVQGKYTGRMFWFEIENTFSNPIKEARGHYLSTKHKGAGIGTESVKNLAEHYNGVVQFKSEEPIFSVSVMLML